MTRKSGRRSRTEKQLALLVLAAVLLGTALPGRIIVAVSPSLSHRVFFRVPVPGKIEDGDYLVFRHRDPTMLRFLAKGVNRENDLLVKKVGCGPGDLLVRERDGFHCSDPVSGEDVFLGRPLQTDSKGRTLPRFDFRGIVPQDSYFMVGSNPRSFDSRYFGFIHGDEILYKALPIW